MKIITVIGARPQFVKASVVSRAIAAHNAESKSFPIVETILHTGQHFDKNMSRLFFDELAIPQPKWNLAISRGTHGQNTGQMLEAIEATLIHEMPDRVLVYGDTNSTLAAALAAAKLHIPVAHVEAGLRSFNRDMPEEINRIVTDHISSLLLVPTVSAVENLRAEGISGKKVRNVGDVMFDAALFYADMARNRSIIMRDLGLEQGYFMLATVHRPANTDDSARLLIIMRALECLAADMTVVFPLHPRTRKRLAEIGFNSRASGLKVIDPVGYLDMIILEKNAALIATDSGGIQKEAFFHRVPCVTLRPETEWTELLRMGWNRLAPLDSSDGIVATVRAALLKHPACDETPYGDGDSASKIVSCLCEQSN